MNNYCKSLLVFLVSCFFIFPFLNAQIVYKGVVRTDKSWSQLMQDPTVNFYDVQATFNDWYEQTKPKKGIKPYKRWEAFMEPRVFPTGERPDPSIVINELEKFKKENPTESTNGNWSFLGPTVINGSIPNGPYQSPGGNGRINCIVFDPGYNGTTNQILWVGTPSGGLWKTENNGTTWVSTAMDLSSIGVSHIVIDPANSNNMWIATGDGEVGDTYSNGVMRSIDGGVNWAVTSFTALPSNYYRVRRLLADPSNVLIQIAFCNGITYRTTDGWVTRNTVASLGANIIDDAEYMPGTNGATVYASLTTGGAAQLWRSVDHGATFALCASGLPAAGVERIAIAVSNAAPNNVWALIGRSSDQGLMGVYRSTTGLGTAFATLTGTSPNLLGWNADFSDAGGQAFFDLSIQVNPNNANEVFTGGVNLAKSVDGGTNWVCSGYWLRGAPGYQYVHADHHSIEYAANGWIFNGNDGGVFLSKDNGATWYDISNNLGIAQIARMGHSSTNKDLILTGMQDNGSNKFANGKWEVIRGGDGCEQIVDPTNNNIIFSSYVGGVVYRSVDAGVTWTTVLNSGGGWITPYIMDPVNHNNMYSASYPSFRKSTNNGVTWANAGAYNPAVAGTYPNWLTIGTTNPAVLFCSNQAQIWKSTNSATSWANGIGDLAVTAAISCIEVSPDDITHVTVTLSGYNAAQKVYHSTNGGTNWSNITSNLPNSPVNVVVYERGNVNRRVYVGTDIGVYYKDDTQPNWTLFDAGLPTVSVHDMEIFYGATYCDHRLRIATYGRSVWESDLVGGGTIAYTSSNTTQTNTNFVNKGDVSQEIVGVKITMSNCGDPLVVTDFQFTTTGSTNPLNDITNARLYYTGAVPNFEPIQQFGNVIVNPNGTFTITSSRNLVGGDNYFWLTYDIRPTATSNNFVDAECTQITINGINRVPTTTAPVGNRQIKNSTIIGPGTEISYNYGPIYRSSAASTFDYSRYLYLFTQAELTAIGLTNGSIINTLAWIKSNSASTLGNANFRIYLKNSALTFLTSPTVWATAIGTMTLVYNSATQTVPFAAGWNTFDITDFTYTGGALEVAVEWDISGVAGNPTTGPFYWTYSNMPALYTLGGAGTALPANVVSATYGGNVRPNMQMTFTAPLVGPIQVTATAGTLGPTNYTSLKLAFDAINNGTHQGAITIKVNGSSVETLNAKLYQSGYLGLSSYSSVLMYPTTSGLVISSNRSTSGNAELIDLDGADNVIIDGRVNQIGPADLTLTHTGTDNSSRNIRFINSAENNTVRYCKIRGACPSSGAGLVFFSTASAGNGNDNNTIDNCDITNSGVRPFNVISSIGTAGMENSGNIIRNNNFYDFLNPANTSRAIYLSSNTTDWTISDNNFYETTNLAPTAAVTYQIIYISNTGGNFTISGNYIGGSGPSCAGTFIKTNSQNNIFYGIWLSVGSTPVCNIQGNTIQSFNWSNLLNANWAGIYCSSGIVNIGTIIPNIVGSSTVNGSITITNTTSTGSIYGIFASTATPNTSNIQNNLISSYTLGGAAGIIYNFYGISTSGTGNFNISSNTIGSTSTTNSISVGTIGVSTAALTLAGIINSATGTVFITSNTIQNCTNFGTGASVLYGVLNSGGTGALNINSNNFITLTHYGTSSFNCVSNIAATPIVNINNNILRNLVINSNCLFYGLFNSAANATAININNNQFGNTSGGFVTYPLAAAGSLYAVGNSGGTGTCAVSISGNDIRGITHSILGSTTHTYIYNSANTLSCNISNNTFTNLNVNTSGAVTFIQNTSFMGATSTQTINNNSIVTAFNKTGSGSGVSCYTGGGSAAGATITHSGNNFSNITVDGTSGIIGWRNTNNYGTTVTGNTFSNWTSGSGFSYGIIISAGGASNFNTYSNNTISNFSGSGGFFGIQVVGAGNFGTITSNTINGIYTTGGQIVGITSQLGTTTGGTISRNKIYDLSYNTLYGIWIVSSTPGGSTHNIFNNRIADLKPVSGGSSTLIYGIYIQNAVPLGKMNVFYNSIYLNASTTGATLGTIGLLHVYDATATTSELELRNNIVVNISTPKGGGRTVAFQRTGAANLNNYNTNSNNNLFYAGTPGANNLIYSDGANFDQTLLAFKTRVFPREVFSVTELPPFLSTVGSNVNFLKIDPTIATQAESGASNIATYIDDFEGDIRQGNPGYAGTGTQPDIGADEFNGLRIDTWVGTVSEDFNTANNWRCKVVPLSGANVVFDVRPFNHCKLDIDRTINNLTNAQSTYDMFPNSRTLTIQGSLIFSGGAQIDNQAAPSKVEFNGSVAQVMPAGCFVNNTVNDIIINNSNGVSMGGVGNITINGTLTLTSGILTTGANIMDLSTLGTIVETPIAPTSYVLGNLRSTRNIGGAVNQTFGGIGLEINEPGALNSTVATRVTGTQLNGNAPCCNLNLSIRRYFDISPTINAGLNANMTFKYFDWEIAGYTEANLKLYKAPLPYLPNTWVEQLSAVVSPVNNWLTQSGITSFSRWTAADLNNPLPVQLLKFEAFRNGNKIDLGWTTASEVNNDFFTLEKSPDTKNWNILGFVDGAGNSNQPLKYEFFDYNPLMGIQYYRLKQTDFNGKYTNSGIVNVNFLLENNNEICLYPNPTEGEFNLYVSGETDKFINIRLINAMGQLIWEKDIMAGIKQVFNIEDQPNGLYYLEVKNDQNIERFKLVKD